MIRRRIAAALRRVATWVDPAPAASPTFADVCEAYRTLQLAEVYPFSDDPTQIPPGEILGLFDGRLTLVKGDKP